MCIRDRWGGDSPSLVCSRVPLLFRRSPLSSPSAAPSSSGLSPPPFSAVASVVFSLSVPCALTLLSQPFVDNGFEGSISNWRPHGSLWLCSCGHCFESGVPPQSAMRRVLDPEFESQRLPKQAELDGFYYDLQSMAMSPSTERSRSDTNASVNSSHAFREIEEQWDWEWELDQWDLSYEKIWGTFYQLSEDCDGKRSISYQMFKTLAGRSRQSGSLDEAAAVEAKLFSYFNLRVDGPGNLENEVVEFSEFDAAMRMMVQYEWKERGWRSAVVEESLVMGKTDLFSHLDAKEQLGVVMYDRFNWDVQLPLGNPARRRNSDLGMNAKNTSYGLFSQAAQSLWAEKQGSSECAEGPEAYEAFYHPSNEAKDDRKTMMWVRTRGNSKEVVVSTGLRYGIHPLIMEDALTMKGNKTGARIEWWSGESPSGPGTVESLQIMLPLLRISQADLHDLQLARRRLLDIAASTSHSARKNCTAAHAAQLRRKMERWSEELMMTRDVLQQDHDAESQESESTASLETDLAGAYVNVPTDTVEPDSTDLANDERWNNAVTMSMHTDLAWVCLLVPFSEQQHNALISFESPWSKFSSSLVEDDTEPPKEEWTWGRSDKDFFEKAVRLVKAQGSRIRNAPSVLPLAAQVVAIAVDGYGIVVEALATKVETITMLLRYYGHTLDKFFVDTLRRLMRKAKKIARTLRPVQQLLEQLLESDLIASMRPVFRDTQTDIAGYREDLSEMIATAQVLLDEHKSLLDQSAAQQDQRMNDTLYFLTLVTTAIIPMQVLTGLYGMNFIKADGSPNMPELTWEYGYVYFWLLSIFSTIILLVTMKKVVGFDVRKHQFLGPLADIGSWVTGVASSQARELREKRDSTR
eukprot:TRINITY_DN13838_c0_g1_i3.p1 TRINITY_DN13838_c0_g1~~TRINITY_DN13838_c0_g1_i3.p1  ORF type:complete len:863 (-),score=158.37 TRINITY_DN13838_c0_g1_i3:36-2624(-)